MPEAWTSLLPLEMSALVEILALLLHTVSGPGMGVSRSSTSFSGAAACSLGNRNDFRLQLKGWGYEGGKMWAFIHMLHGISMFSR